MNRPVPVSDDVDTGGFFAAAAEGRLALRTCTACEAVLHLPKSYCHHCGSWDTTWQDVAPTGTLYTFTVVEHQVHPAFPVPYTIVLVSLDEHPGVRLVGHIPGRPALEIGMPMELHIETVGSGTVPNWRPRPVTRHSQEDL